MGLLVSSDHCIASPKLAPVASLVSAPAHPDLPASLNNQTHSALAAKSMLIRTQAPDQKCPANNDTSRKRSLLEFRNDIAEYRRNIAGAELLHCRELLLRGLHPGKVGIFLSCRQNTPGAYAMWAILDEWNDQA